MLLRRRIGLLLTGFCGSIAVGLFLVTNCVSAASAPVVAQVSMSFPCVVEGTPLVIQGITGYEGPYIEDGSDEEVADVAALILYNAGENMIAAADITVQCAESSFCFVLNDLPAGAGVVVLDQDAQLWTPQNVYRCLASYELNEIGNFTDQQLHVRQTDTSILEISNLTDKTIYDITICHKTWSEEIGCYLGGITYETHIDSLRPGQILLLSPDHYAVGSSKIVNISSS